MRRHAALLTIPILMLAAACSGDDEPGTAPTDPAELVEQAQTEFADAGSVGFTLDSDGIPKDVDGVTGAEGSGIIDADEPKFSGKITGRVMGVSGSLDVIAIGDEAWMKFFTPGYEKVDLQGMGAPNPAMFFHPTDGLPGLLEATTDLKLGDEKRQGSDTVTEVSGKLPAASVQDLLEIGGSEGEYDVVYGITGDGELRTIKVSGEFYSGSDSSYSIVVKDYGKSVEIKRP